MAWDVQVLRLGEAEVPMPEILFMTGFHDWAVMAFPMVVARQGDEVAIVNTGFPDDLTDINAYWAMAFGPDYGQRTQIVRREEERPENLLASIGLTPADVTEVIITPLMPYSAANLTMFPNARYTIGRKGWINRLAPDHGAIKTRGGTAPPLANYRAPIDVYIPEEQLHHLLYEANDRLNLVDDAELQPGLRVWWAGVHHRGSLAVEIDSTAGTVIASDAFFYYENVENNHYLGVGESYEEAMTVYERVRQTADHVIPMQDPKIWDRYPDGRIR